MVTHTQIQQVLSVLCYKCKRVEEVKFCTIPNPAITVTGILSMLNIAYPAAAWTATQLKSTLNYMRRKGLVLCAGGIGDLEGWYVNSLALQVNYTYNKKFTCLDFVPEPCPALTSSTMRSDMP